MKNYRKPTVILLIFIVLVTSGFGCKVVDQKTEEAMKPITLTYWRVWDGPDAFDDIIANYKKIHPFVNINYRKLRYSEYEKELLDAMAEDRGPDIFSIHNTWVMKYKSKIKPMPASITMAYPIEKGTLKKEIIPELRTTKSITLKEIKNNFVDAVYGDVVVKSRDEKNNYLENVYGLPLSVDTMVMYYNRDLLNNAGIPQPPAFWNKEFQDDVKKIVKQDAKGTIVQAGVSLGGSKNVERASDVIAVLMMQNGAEMVDDSNDVVFDRIPPAFQGQNYNPGIEALRFYTDFSNPAKEVYSWNANLEDSLTMFSEGRLAFTFGYAYDLPTIRAQAPKLNFGIAKLPQIEGNTQANFANYWVETVSVKSKYANEAWDFIQFETKAEQAKIYLDKTKKPTALRSLVSSQIDDPDVGVFAEQVLTAKSWYKGYDSAAAEQIMGDMIDAVVSGQGRIEDIIGKTAQKVQQTWDEKKSN